MAGSFFNCNKTEGYISRSKIRELCLDWEGLNTEGWRWWHPTGIGPEMWRESMDRHPGSITQERGGW